MTLKSPINISILVMLAIWISTSDARPCVSDCTGKANGNYPSCDSCKKFVMCSNGYLYTFDCPSDLEWNDNTGVCDWWPSPTCDNPNKVDGNWGRWTPYSDCSVTCGGGVQQRTRACDSPAPSNGGQPCIGIDTETRPCAEWACPDCDKDCSPDGVLDADCTVCLCDETVTGRTRRLAAPGTPLGGVSIRIVGREWEEADLSDSQGYFTLDGYCISHLHLLFMKAGFVPQMVPATAAPMDVLMEELGLIITEHPQSTTAFAGDDVTLTCEAIGSPPPTHYDWFRNGQLYRHSTSGSLGMSPVEEGSYKCRAVSTAMKRFSNAAIVTVTDVGDDTCPDTPLSSVVTLPLGCTANIGGTQQQQITIGRCINHACSVDGGFGSLCCAAIEHEVTRMTCGDIISSISNPTKCGCVTCTDDLDQNVITINGRIFIVTYDGSGEEILTPPGLPIIFTVGSTEHTAVPGGIFTFSMEREGDAVTLLFTPGPADNYMPHLAFLTLVDGVTEYFMTVKLTPPPFGLQLDPAEENRIPADTLNLTLVIPKNSFVDQDGKALDENVDVHVKFTDPRDTSSLGLAAGRFSFLDDEGFEQRLRTYGVINMLARTQSGEQALLSGDMVLEIDADGLGLSEESMPNTATWSIDVKTGQWITPHYLSDAGGRRKKRQGGPLHSVIDSGLPLYNLDESHFGDLCEVSVFAWDFFKVTPKPGVTIEVHSEADQGDCVCRTKHVAATDASGKMCGWVECGNEIEIFAQSANYWPDPLHLLPLFPPFPYANQPTTGHVWSKAPALIDIMPGEGPVHEEATAMCSLSSEFDYHFQFVKTTPGFAPGGGGFRLPGPQMRVLSHDGRVCYVRATFNIAGQHAISAAVLNRESNTGLTYSVGIHPLMDEYEGGVRKVDWCYSCMEVKCPSEDGRIAPNVTIQPVVPPGTPCEIIDLNEERPILNIISYGATNVNFLLNGQTGLDTSELLISATYGTGGVTEFNAMEAALVQCSMGTTRNVVSYQCGTILA